MHRILAAAVAAFATFAAGPPPQPPPTVFVSPTGSDAGRCTRAQPCRSFNRAYRVAQPGETIELAGGTYPTQTIGVDPSKVAAASDVVFQPATGASVTIAGDLVMKGSHAIFKDVTLRFLESQAVAGPTTSNHVKFVDFHGQAFEIGPNSYITIVGGDWGPNTGPNTEENKVGPDGTIPRQWPSHILLDGLTIHDQNSTDLSTQHMGGLFLISGGPITLENSHFLHDVVYDVQVQDFTSPDCCGMTYGPVHNVLMQGNVFEQPVTSLPEGAADDHQPEVQLDPRHGACWRNWTITRNSFQNGLALGFDAQPCFANVSVSNNIGPALGYQCWPGAAGLTWADDVWSGGNCSPEDQGAPYGYALAGLALQPLDPAASAIRTMFTLAAGGATLAQIAGQVHASVTAVKTILADPTYLGNRYGGLGAQPALVSRQLWRASRKALA
jgi:hypothetical protein